MPARSRCGPYRLLALGYVPIVPIVVVCLLPLLLNTPSRATLTTVVSLTFDDGRATQYNARSILVAHDMRGTFYVNSGELGSYRFYLSQQQVRDLYKDGNEIGGHDAYHANLVVSDPVEAKRQVCYDRDSLLAMGFAVTDFAYPYGAYDPQVESLVKSCGYNSARSTVVETGLAESIPPDDPYALRIGTASLALSSLEAAVTSAVQHGGGWVPLVFHDICSGCSALALSAGDFSSLLDWLEQQASNGVVVSTVQDVVGGSQQPRVAGPAQPAAPGATSHVRNASLEYSSDGVAPDCFTLDHYGSNSYAWAHTTDAHKGGFAERVDVSSYTSGEDSLLVREDLGACTPSVTPDHRYRMTTWYKSTSVVSFLVDVRGPHYVFAYWMSSPVFPASSVWTEASWTTPSIPSGINGLSFGLSIDSAGSLTIDDVGLADADASAVDAARRQ